MGGYVDQLGPCPIDDFQVVGLVPEGDVEVGEDLACLVEDAFPHPIDVQGRAETVLSGKMIDQTQVGPWLTSREQVHVESCQMQDAAHLKRFGIPGRQPPGVMVAGHRQAEMRRQTP